MEDDIIAAFHYLEHYTVNVVSIGLITIYALIHKHRVSPSQITRLKRNEFVSTHTIDMFCKILDCRVEDVMEYIPDVGK